MHRCRKFDCSRIVVGKLPGPSVGTLQGPQILAICRNFAYASCSITFRKAWKVVHYTEIVAERQFISKPRCLFLFIMYA